MLAQSQFVHSEDVPSIEAITAFRARHAAILASRCRKRVLGDARPIAVKLLGRRLVVARLDDELVVLPDTCRHFQAQLSLGTIVRVGAEAGLQCPYHGWTFGSSGRCLRIPQLTEGRSIPASANLPSYRALERYGLVWVNLEQTSSNGIPDFPEFDDPSFRKLRLTESEPMRTSSTRMVMATLDDTHFPWVHEGILGDRTISQDFIPKKGIEASRILCRFYRATTLPSMQRHGSY